MLLDEQLFEDNNKVLTYDEKVAYIRNYPTYQSGHDKYFTRPCKVWDLNLTPHQIDAWDGYMESGELSIFWQENSELADKIYQDGRMGGHLILDDEEAMPNDWSEFSSFDDVFQACLDEYSYYYDDPIQEWEYSQAKEKAESMVDTTYNKVKSFDERVDQLIELLKQSLDAYGTPEERAADNDLEESIDLKEEKEMDDEVKKEIDWVFANNDQELAYRMLDRLRTDCTYILGAVKDESEDHKIPLDVVNKFLWFHDIDKQIDFMKGIYERLNEKPEWLSLEQINDFEHQLKDVVREEKVVESLISESRSKKLTYDKLYDILEDAGYHLFASSEYDNALALSKKEEERLKAAKDICDQYNLEYDVKFFKPTERYHMTIFLPDDMLEEQLSRNNVVDLARKHNVEINFTDDIASDKFMINGDPKDMSEFFDDYKNEYIKSEEQREEVKAESMNEELSETTLKDTALKNILSSLIQDELQAIDGYNSAIVTFESEGASQFTDMFRDIITEENKHIGQLQAALSEIDPQSGSDIEAGQTEGEEQIKNDLDPADIQEVEVTEKSE